MLLALAEYKDYSEATRTPAQRPQHIDTHAAPSSTNQLHVFIYKNFPYSRKAPSPKRSPVRNPSERLDFT